MITNINPETGIRYGIISANSLDPEVLDDIQRVGTDIRYAEALESLRELVNMECAELGGMTDTEIEDRLEQEEYKLADSWQDDEPIYEFEMDGVTGRTTWLGGALHVWVFESPHLTFRRLCSPCVPNAMDLDGPLDIGGYQGYDVPPGWRLK